eukprot:tig00020830_g14496.t1
MADEAAEAPAGLGDVERRLHSAKYGPETRLALALQLLSPDERRVLGIAGGDAAGAGGEAACGELWRIFPSRHRFLLDWITKALIHSCKPGGKPGQEAAPAHAPLHRDARFMRFLAYILAHEKIVPALLASSAIYYGLLGVFRSLADDAAGDAAGEGDGAAAPQPEEALRHARDAYGIIFSKFSASFRPPLEQHAPLVASLARAVLARPSGTALPFLAEALDAYGAGQRRQSNQRKVFSVAVSALLECLLALRHRFGGEPAGPLRTVAEAAGSILAGALFHPDQLSDYTLAFAAPEGEAKEDGSAAKKAKGAKGKGKEEGPKAERRITSYQRQLFDALSPAAPGGGPGLEAAAAALPWLLSAFVSAWRARFGRRARQQQQPGQQGEAPAGGKGEGSEDEGAGKEEEQQQRGRAGAGASSADQPRVEFGFFRELVRIAEAAAAPPASAAAAGGEDGAEEKKKKRKRGSSSGAGACSSAASGVGLEAACRLLEAAERDGVYLVQEDTKARAHTRFLAGLAERMAARALAHPAEGGALRALGTLLAMNHALVEPLLPPLLAALAARPLSPSQGTEAGAALAAACCDAYAKLRQVDQLHALLLGALSAEAEAAAGPSLGALASPAFLRSYAAAVRGLPPGQAAACFAALLAACTPAPPPPRPAALLASFLQNLFPSEHSAEGYRAIAQRARSEVAAPALEAARGAPPRSPASRRRWAWRCWCWTRRGPRRPLRRGARRAPRPPSSLLPAADLALLAGLAEAAGELEPPLALAALAHAARRLRDAARRPRPPRRRPRRPRGWPPPSARACPARPGGAPGCPASGLPAARWALAAGCLAPLASLAPKPALSALADCAVRLAAGSCGAARRLLCSDAACESPRFRRRLAPAILSLVAELAEAAAPSAPEPQSAKKRKSRGGEAAAPAGEDCRPLLEELRAAAAAAARDKKDGPAPAPSDLPPPAALSFGPALLPPLCGALALLSDADGVPPELFSPAQRRAAADLLSLLRAPPRPSPATRPAGGSWRGSRGRLRGPEAPAALAEALLDDAREALEQPEAAPGPAQVPSSPRPSAFLPAEPFIRQEEDGARLRLALAGAAVDALLAGEGAPCAPAAPYAAGPAAVRGYRRDAEAAAAAAAPVAAAEEPDAEPEPAVPEAAPAEEKEEKGKKAAKKRKRKGDEDEEEEDEEEAEEGGEELPSPPLSAGQAAEGAGEVAGDAGAPDDEEGEEGAGAEAARRAAARDKGERKRRKARTPAPPPFGGASSASPAGGGGGGGGAGPRLEEAWAALEAAPGPAPTPSSSRPPRGAALAGAGAFTGGAPLRAAVEGLFSSATREQLPASARLLRGPCGRPSRRRTGPASPAPPTHAPPSPPSPRPRRARALARHLPPLAVALASAAQWAAAHGGAGRAPGEAYCALLRAATTIASRVSAAALATPDAASLLAALCPLPPGVPPAAHSAAYRLLYALLRHRTPQALRCLPHLVSCARALLFALASGHPPALFRDLARLYEELAKSRSAVRKYCPHLLADFLAYSTASGVAAERRRLLLPGIFALMEACSDHEFKQLFVALDAAGRALFRTTHAEFVRDFKYTGKV